MAPKGASYKPSSSSRKLLLGGRSKRSGRRSSRLPSSTDESDEHWLDYSDDAAPKPTAHNQGARAGRHITLNVPIPTLGQVLDTVRKIGTALSRRGRSTAGYVLVPLSQGMLRLSEGDPSPTRWEPPPAVPASLQRRISFLKSVSSIIAYALLVILILINVAGSLTFLYLPVPFPIPKLMLNHSRLAVMIERRNQPHLIPILHNFLTHVDWEWPFLVYYGRDNVQALNTSRLLKPFMDSGKLRLLPLPNEDDVHDGPTLSRYLTRPTFWEQLPGEPETLLFFQADSVLCSNSQRTINDFLGFEECDGGYDWVGAPWDWRHYPSEPYGGNGGFSIRRRSTMLNVTRTYEDWNENPEDVWFAERIALLTHRFPTIDKAMEFSFENPPYEVRGVDWIYNPLGMHIGHGEEWPTCRDQDASTTQKLLEWCPELKLFLPNHCVIPH